MKLRTFLIINAIVALVYGIVELLIPATMLALYGIVYSVSARLMAQYFGVTLIGVGLLMLLVRNVTDPAAQRAVIIAFLVSDIIGVIVSVIGTVSGVMSAVGWSAVVIYVLLALGFVYFLFKKPSAAEASPSP
jgi:hypothetical protein